MTTQICNLLTDILYANRRVKVDKADIADNVAKVLGTLDAINGLGRFETRLPNGYAVEEYRIQKKLEPLVLPAAVTVVNSTRFADFLDRTVKYTDSGEAVTPGEFVEAQRILWNALKASIKDEDWVILRRDSIEITDNLKLAYDGKTEGAVEAAYPIPVTINVMRSEYLTTPVDEEYVGEWLRVNFVNTL